MLDEIRIRNWQEPKYGPLNRAAVTWILELLTSLDAELDGPWTSTLTRA